jgi:DNA (cytosine-5)-methyltransferase 1
LNADLRTISICTGLGGLELGVKSVAKTRTVMYVENEITAAQILAQRIKEGNIDDAPIWSNLRTFRGEGLHGKVDILIGGFPCQPFSVAGKRLGDDDPRNLWHEVKRIARELGHPTLFLENVENISRYYHDTIRKDLQEMGYTVTEGLFSASEVGLPHRRRRLLMLACVTDTDYLKPYLLSNSNNTGDSTQRHESDEHREETDKRQTRFTFAESTGQSEVVENGIGIGQPRGKRGLQESRDGGQSTEDKAEATSYTQSNGKEELADCSVQGLQGPEHNQSVKQTSGCGYRIRFAPPTIDDDIGWAHTLAHMPEIEPSFCRVVNGLPIGMEQRLRTLGNAVVPAMAAKGFTELVKKLQTSK